MPRVYPTLAETIETHRILIEEFGGLQGVRDQGLLESAVGRPQTGYYNDVLEEAAALMESLANNHPFHDGNKRISFTMADILLRANGYFLEVAPEDANKFIADSLTKNNFRFSAIREWIASIVKPLATED